jgi:hypothetical protein
VAPATQPFQSLTSIRPRLCFSPHRYRCHAQPPSSSAAPASPLQAPSTAPISSRSRSTSQPTNVSLLRSIHSAITGPTPAHLARARAFSALLLPPPRSAANLHRRTHSSSTTVHQPRAQLVPSLLHRPRPVAAPLLFINPQRSFRRCFCAVHLHRLRRTRFRRCQLCRALQSHAALLSLPSLLTARRKEED